jgi:two-component system, response regulator PdtaR
MDLEALLTQRGWRVISAATVQAALRLVETERPNVALLDVNLRGEMVTLVAAALQRFDVPFVLSSAYGETDLPRVDLLVGAPKVSKPVSPQRLFSVLDEAVKRT